MFILTCQQRRKYFVHAGAAVCVLSCLLLPGCADKQGVRPISPDNAWHEFEGTWTAEGSRTTMQLGSGRRASIVTYKGSLVLSGPSRPGVGFLSDAIVFNDTETGAVGRAVWTDEHGDKAF